MPQPTTARRHFPRSSGERPPAAGRGRQEAIRREQMHHSRKQSCALRLWSARARHAPYQKERVSWQQARLPLATGRATTNGRASSPMRSGGLAKGPAPVLPSIGSTLGASRLWGRRKGWIWPACGLLGLFVILPAAGAGGPSRPTCRGHRPSWHAAGAPTCRAG